MIKSTVFLKMTAAAGIIFLSATAVYAFCGFYVARADAALFNKSSRVVLVRDGVRTVLTMSNDFQGDPKEFAIVIPVPTFLQKDQIHVGEQKLIDHLDAYSAPRLVEYFDSDPCQRYDYEKDDTGRRSEVPANGGRKKNGGSHGVTIEATYTVGEYDILILSAKDSSGLETWLIQNGYKIPKGAARVLETYIKTGTRFFVAKVNLKEQAKLGFTFLRPIQIAFESPKFMLPIRLGMVNAQGPQDLFIYTLTKKGRVETTNYRTIKLPSDMDIPVFIKKEFGEFYKDMFTEQVKRENGKAVFLEYAWDMAWCDPCAAEPLSGEELRGLGVFWVEKSAARGAAPVFVSRLHVRYDDAHFPDDLVFQETGDKANFQARYVLRHPFTGAASCDAARQYKKNVVDRQNREATVLANLTGWDIGTIRKKMGLGDKPAEGGNWWNRIWE